MVISQKKINRQYILASILMVTFVLCDLMFDFIFNFDGSNLVSLGFTILTAIITFIGSNGVIKLDIKHKTDRLSVFIRANFNSPQVIFSILDIICTLISIMSGIIIFLGLFKVLKIIYVPIEFINIANKWKSLLKVIYKFSLVWVIGRLLSNNFKGEFIMKEWIKNNKITLTYCVVASPISVFLSYVAINYYFTNLPLWSNIVIAIVVVILTCALVINLGGDKVLQAQFRALSLTLDDENAEKVKQYATNLLNEQNLKEEIHKLALEKIAEEEKQKANQVNVVSDEEKQALINAEILRIQSETESKTQVK